MLNPVIIETQMLIRKPIHSTFEAFIDPEITSKFWFSSATGKLEQGKTVEWTWEKYQVSAKVKVTKIISNELIQIQWGEPSSTVDFIFEALNDNQTYVRIQNYNIPFQGDELISFIIDSTGGFTTVLDSLKAYLEHGLKLNLVQDKFPPF
ncbi:SRPBCC family protein [Acinetobacter sp. C26M]|uniref:SRPBCC family protein n=1 Tax=unclassified Acinetobacter TaxID=196816 RepID=UPI002037038C|nr:MULTISPECIES: SRPBCC family protein [unclassified Acinetobacter]USA45637.1 SRPBCC family protein [Acinetobacter sp. C26M]USA49136.1 SRPBCC family protein [Acinetobacter sp. C26G]